MDGLPESGSYIDYNSLHDPLVYTFSDHPDTMFNEMVHFLLNYWTADTWNDEDPEDFVPYGWGMDIGKYTYGEGEDEDLIMELDKTEGIEGDTLDFLPEAVRDGIDELFQRGRDYIDEEGGSESLSISTYIRRSGEAYEFVIIYRDFENPDIRHHNITGEQAMAVNGNNG